MLVLRGGGVVPVGGQLTFDGPDVTLPLAGCLRAGVRLAGGLTFRCPGLSGALLPPGVHSLAVDLNLSDGSTASDTVRWEIDANREQ